MTRPRDSARPVAYELHFEHVTSDGAAVDASFERVTKTALPEAEVLEVLKRFAAIDAVQTLEIEPQITVRAPHVCLQVRPYRGGLLVCDPTAAERVWREVALGEITHALRPDTTNTADTASATEPEAGAMPPARRTRHWPFAMLLVGLALNGYVIVSLFVVRPDTDFVPAGDGRPPPDVVKKITGSYAATPPANVTRIELQPPNIVVFHDTESGQNRTDSYLYGNSNKRPRLLTGSHGFIDLAEGQTLEFAGQRYERAAPAP